MLLVNILHWLWELLTGASLSYQKALFCLYLIIFAVKDFWRLLFDQVQLPAEPVCEAWL